MFLVNICVDGLQQTVISVGTRVYLNIGNNKTKPYLLLRLLPVDYLKNAWAFPTEYKSAEISLINSNGEYVIQSPSMKSRTFYDYIRGYNFQNVTIKSTSLLTKLNRPIVACFNTKTIVTKIAIGTIQVLEKI